MYEILSNYSLLNLLNPIIPNAMLKYEETVRYYYPQSALRSPRQFAQS